MFEDIRMAKDGFDWFFSEINEADLWGDAMEHTHRPGLNVLVEVSLGNWETS
jgi:hypothetical protein